MMKDSGIEWVGSIPDKWDVIPAGGLFTEIKEKNKNLKYTNPLQFRFGTIVDKAYTGDLDESLLETLRTYTCVEPDTIMLNGLNLNYDFISQRVGIVTKPGVITSAYLAVYPDKKRILPRYANYLLKAYDSIFVFHGMGSGVRKTLQWKDFKNLKFVLPSIEEQATIIKALDSLCAKTDTLIANVQTQIEKLKAYKQSVITEVVTKGLDPTVPMKDSGVENVGEIPRHWEMTRLKYLLSHIIDCPHETPSYSSDGNYYVIRTADQDVAKLRSDEDMYRLDEGEYQNRIRRQSLDKDDIVYGREGERWGLACLVPESNKYCLGQRMMQFRCHNLLFLPQYAVYALSSQYVYQQGFSDTMGSTSPHVNISSIRNFYIPIPPLNEQFELARYLREKCSQIDQLISIKQSKIEKLEQYKRSLIYEYVTGKRDVM